MKVPRGIDLQSTGPSASLPYTNNNTVHITRQASRNEQYSSAGILPQATHNRLICQHRAHHAKKGGK